MEILWAKTPLGMEILEASVTIYKMKIAKNKRWRWMEDRLSLLLYPSALSTDAAPTSDGGNYHDPFTCP